MKNWQQQSIPVMISLTCLGIGIWSILTAFYRQNPQFDFTYALDDAYIHIAMAKNLAFRGVFGVLPDTFSSSSSSPLWTFLLAGLFRLVGVVPLGPFWLNIGAAVGLIVALAWIVNRHLKNPLAQTGFILVVLAVAAVAPLVFAGMEHILQSVVVLLFAYQAARQISGEPIRSWVLPGLAALASLIRYESLFLIAVVAGLLVLRRRWKTAIWLVIAGVLPLAIFGLISVWNGAPPVPNPILLKGVNQALEKTSIGSFLMSLLAKLYFNPALPALWAGAAILQLASWGKSRPWGLGQVLMWIFLGTSTFQILFAGLGWFFRYEAYLLILGLVAVLVYTLEWKAERPTLQHQRVWNLIGAVTILLVGACLANRATLSLSHAPRAMANIYSQQIQMGKFLQQYYPGENVAANDIGAISYLAGVRCLDLVGLADLEVTRLRMQQAFDTQAIAGLADRRQVKIAVVYESWFEGDQALPQDWQKIATWEVLDNVVLGDPQVSFFAVQPDQAEQLRRQLTSFSKQLPPGVRWSILEKQVSQPGL